MKIKPLIKNDCIVISSHHMQLLSSRFQCGVKWLLIHSAHIVPGSLLNSCTKREVSQRSQLTIDLTTESFWWKTYLRSSIIVWSPARPFLFSYNKHKLVGWRTCNRHRTPNNWAEYRASGHLKTIYFPHVPSKAYLSRNTFLCLNTKGNPSGAFATLSGQTGFRGLSLVIDGIHCDGWIVATGRVTLSSIFPNHTTSCLRYLRRNPQHISVFGCFDVGKRTRTRWLAPIPTTFTPEGGLCGCGK